MIPVRYAKTDKYICLEGHELKPLRRSYSDPNRGRSGKGKARYHALERLPACQAKAQCCPNADARSIIRDEHQGARQVAGDLAKIDRCEIVMKRRKTVEMLFAHLTPILGSGRLRLCGPRGATDEFLLAATAQPAGKCAKLFPAPAVLPKGL